MITPAPGETIFHHYLEIFVTASIPAAFGLFGWAMQKLFSMGRTINSTAFEVATIKTNHLPHLDEKVEKVSDAVIELRGKFIDHINTARD